MHDRHPDQVDGTRPARTANMRFVCKVTRWLETRVSSASDQTLMDAMRSPGDQPDGELTTGARTALPDKKKLYGEPEEMDALRDDVAAARSRGMEDLQRAKQKVGRWPSLARGALHHCVLNATHVADAARSHPLERMRGGKRSRLTAKRLAARRSHNVWETTTADRGRYTEVTREEFGNALETAWSIHELYDPLVTPEERREPSIRSWRLPTLTHHEESGWFQKW